MGREETFHPVLGPGSFKHVPKSDVRRIETCVPASSVVECIQETLNREPGLELYTSSVRSATTNGGEDSSSQNKGGEWAMACPVKGGQSPPRVSDGGAAASSVSEQRTTLKELADAFFGPTALPRERVFSAEGLGLRLNYSELTAHMADIFKGGEARQDRANCTPILQEFLDIYKGNGGELLRRLVAPMINRVTANKTDVLEIEFTVDGHCAGEIQHVAAWCARSGCFASGKARPSLRILLRSLPPKGQVCEAQNMEDMLKNIFEPLWIALLVPGEHPDIVNFFYRLTSISVLVGGEADVQEMPDENNPRIYCGKDGIVPSSAFFIYHVWRNVQLLNCFVATQLSLASEKGSEEAVVKGMDVDETQAARAAASKVVRHRGPLKQQPLRFRVFTHGTRKKTFSESVMGLLVADQVVGPHEVISWKSLTYLYYITQRSLVMTPAHDHGGAPHSTLGQFVPLAVETGLCVSIATLDPLYYHTNELSFAEECNSIMKSHQLGVPEIMELCLHSAEYLNIDIEERCALLGGPWQRVRSLNNEFSITQVNSLRLRFRELSLAHEMDLLCRKGLNNNSQINETAPGGTIGLGSWLWPEELFPLSVEGRREALWRYLDIPPLSEKGGKGVDIEGGGSLRFVDEMIKYPRIVVLGPLGGKSFAAQNVVDIIRRRMYYRSFVVHHELPPSAAPFPNTPSMEGLLAPSASSFRHRGSSTEMRRIGQGNELLLPAQNSRWSPIAADEQLDLPTNLCNRNGVRDVIVPSTANTATKHYFRPVPTWSEFQADVRGLRIMSTDSTLTMYAKRRLEMLECKFNLHVALTNDDLESNGHSVDMLREKSDMYRCVKVDVHCHMASGMTAKELLKFIKEKMRVSWDDVVDSEKGTGRLITLGELFGKVPSKEPFEVMESVEELTIASLGVKAGKATFNRFDIFNGRYSPLGRSVLRSVLLKTDNFIGGRYFAELIRKVFDRQAADGYTFSEYRLSIYGRSRDEWARLSRWFVMHGMLHPTNCWMVQVPRLYSIYRRENTISSFEDILTNIFLPLWEASIYPERYPFLNYFLAHVSGFDIVDNESEREIDSPIDVTPTQWTSSENPPLTYWLYYMWANIVTLNRYRAARGLSTFTLRPHAGESGDPGHLADAFFVADGVNHGINLKDTPLLQYLYYLEQIPLGITPLSNNALFCKYNDNPFASFFRRGLNVTLSTDGALIFHHTEEPLIEEYSTAANYWNLSQVDMCEIAKNSILMSGFPSYRKKEWLGDLYTLRSAAGNDRRLSRIPHSRCTFRYEVYMEEINYLEARASKEVLVKQIMTPQLEGLFIMSDLGITRDEMIRRQLSGTRVSVTSKTDSITDVSNQKKPVVIERSRL
uniref:Putative AMP deaminase n=1 Tax=Trypanosoma congolense (strain IL3000) TaxID=1068625 RepID=G0V011_TRYCI|nr:putative AMP deaminase [Trypanosoma congolense IL3000]